MKKIIIVITLFFFVFCMNQVRLQALELETEKSPYFFESNIENNFTYIGHYIDTDLSNIIEGLMSYKRKHFYDFQASDNIFIKYEGDLYPYVQSHNHSLFVGIQTLNNNFIASSTYGIQIGIEDCNTGFGYKKTYIDILKESEFSFVNYNLSSGNVLDMTPIEGAWITGNNETVAVYSKTIKVKVLKTELRQTGPIWNVYWTISGVSEYFYDIHLGFTFVPITNGVKDMSIVQTGSFYLDKLHESVKDGYISS